MIEIQDNNIDNNVDNEIYNCLNPLNPKSFFLFAGAGSGKTRSLVEVLSRFKNNYGKQFRLNRQKIAIITYTNAASDEIKHRLEFDSIFYVSTIHSFSWELIKHLKLDIKDWLKINLKAEISELEEAQGKSKDLQNKTSIDRAKKIESKTKRLQFLDKIVKFTYNPNGDNISKDSLNHAEVISITAYFIKTKHLMQDILACRFPIMLVDESQDTKKELVDALFELQERKKDNFSLGLFGDIMQRIYSDGKENLGQNLPKDWVQPSKKMNHRSNKRIISLINDIRKEVDGQKQIPRHEKEDGFVRLFICDRSANKSDSEINVAKKMSELTKDFLWDDVDKSDVKKLILEHHMAANRMGFLEFFTPLYKEDKLKTGLLDGSLSGANFFTKIILPLVEANKIGDKFSIARIVKRHSKFLKKDELLKSTEQLENIKNANEALTGLLALWKNGQDPQLISILNYIHKSGLFPIPENLFPIISRTNKEQKKIRKEVESNEEDENSDSIIDAWDMALSSPFSQIEKYYEYLSENSKFGTHQGVKGLEYPRVMVIVDDEEARGFLFSYDKLFGSKELSPADKKNIVEGKETGIDRTRRLFYVACSRAKESLAIVAYTNQSKLVKENAMKYGWFKDEEIEII